MSADFWASYASGALGILIGNPPRRNQSSSPSRSLIPHHHLHQPCPTSTLTSSTSTTMSPAHPDATLKSDNTKRLTSLFRGAAAPILGYGALNSNPLHDLQPHPPLPGTKYLRLHQTRRRRPLSKIWVAGAIGGSSYVGHQLRRASTLNAGRSLVVDGQGSSLGVFAGDGKEGGG